MKDEDKTKEELIKELKLLREEQEKGVFKDIAKHKQAEEELRESGEKWRSIVSVLPDYVSLLDREGRFLFLNHYAEGFTEKEVIGSSVYQYLSTQSKEIFAKEIAECQNTGKIRKFEHSAMGDHGIMREYEDYLVPLLEKNQVTNIMVISRDITERKQAEEALQKANLKLQELDQLKSMFVASMSHELKTPLTLIIGFTDVILSGISGEINEEQRKQLTLVKNHANHLLDLINDAIDISKIDAGIVEIAIGKFDLSVLSQEIKDNFTVAAAKKGLELSLEAPPILLIEGEEKRTKQILVNFLSNALKFTARGEIKIKIATKDQMVEIAVRDIGIGIRREDMDKLFKPFSRINGPGKIEEGSGLGLYLSKKNANLLGGDIRVESELGKGSVFTLTLPLKYKETKA